MKNKYGLVGNLKAQKGKGPELLSILLQGAEYVGKGSACLLYLVSVDASDSDLICITEVWNSKEEHDQSLAIPGVRELITQALPLLDGPPQRGLELVVKGGWGLPV